MSINFAQKQMAASTSGLKKQALNPLGGGRPWSKVEKDIVDTFNDFTKEFVR